MSENLRRYTKAVYGLDAVVQRADTSRWGNASPCEDWSATDVLAHNVGMCNMVASFATGSDSPRPEHPDISADPAAAWAQARDGLLNALDHAGSLQAVAKTPWGEMPANKFLGFAWVDPVIHTWDLAMALGQHPIVDAELVAKGVVQLERAGDSLVAPGRFKPPTDVGDDASPLDRFVALSGRAP